MLRTKKRFLIVLLSVITVIVTLQAVSATSGTLPKNMLRYTYCESNTFAFITSYNTSFTCQNIGSTTISLQSTNYARTRANGALASNTYKEAYVAIKNANQTWKSDTKSNSTLATVEASVNPVLFTPVFSQHDLIIIESTGEIKEHSRIYQ